MDSKERTVDTLCADLTRVAVLKNLLGWVIRADSMSLLSWLYGPMGAGKSTIARTLAEMCEKKCLLAATFVFSRTASEERKNGDFLLPTIVSQLLQRFPELADVTLDAISVEGDLFERSRSTQLKRLLIEPFRILADKNRLLPTESDSHTSFGCLTGSARLIMIDGFDECEDVATQVELLKIIADASLQLLHPFRFLIISRPEAYISSAFEDKLVTSHPNKVRLRIHLNNEPDAETDIKYYVTLEFDRMRSEHPYRHTLPFLWPPIGAVETLVQRASKQLIYPSISIQFIWKNDDFPLRS